MINVGLYYKVKKGSEKEFEDKFNSVVKMLKGSASGIRDAKLYREIGSSESMIYTEWENMEAFKGFIQSKDFHETTSQGRSIIEGMPRHRVFSELQM